MVKVDVGSYWDWDGARRVKVVSVSMHFVEFDILNDSSRDTISIQGFEMRFKPAINPAPGLGQRWVAYELLRQYKLKSLTLTSHDDVKLSWNFDGEASENCYVRSGFIWDKHFKDPAMMRYLSGKIPVDAKRFPHKCPRCTAPAYVGGGPSAVDCSNASCLTKGLTIRI